MTRFELTALLVLFGMSAAQGGEVLYNGIELPDEWPPRDVRFERFQNGDPAPEPPYLQSFPSTSADSCSLTIF